MCSMVFLCVVCSQFSEYSFLNIIYWTGTAVIAVFVLGACNASNLIDGLDGLLSGTTAIASIGLLAISLLVVFADPGPRDAQRIVLCMALLGGCVALVLVLLTLILLLMMLMQRM